MSSEETGLSLSQIKDFSKDISTSKLLPQALRDSPANVYLILATGRDLGLAPTVALRMLDVVDGRISMRADGMAALVRRSGLCKTLKIIKSDEKGCVYEAERSDSPGVETFSFTMEDAARAGLALRQSYKAYPKQMLRARCLSMTCKAVWPDVVGGLYDTDEVAETPQNAEIQSVKERIAKHLGGEVVEVKADTALPIPPPPPPPVVVEETPVGDKKKEPLKVLAGELKGEVVTDLTQDQCYSVIAELTAKVTEDPKARWAKQVNKHIEELKAVAPTLSPTTEPNSEDVPF